MKEVTDSAIDAEGELTRGTALVLKSAGVTRSTQTGDRGPKQGGREQRYQRPKF